MKSPAPSPAIAARFDEATALHTEGRLEEAIRLYRENLSGDAAHADSLHLLGLALYQCGQSPEGLACIDQAIALNPLDAAYFSNRGSVLKTLGRLEDSLRSYQSSLALDPCFLPAVFNSGEIYGALNRIDEGVAAYRRAVELNDRLPDTWTNLGICLIKQDEEGNASEAERCLRKALELAPSFGPALYGLAHLHEMGERNAEARLLLTQAMNHGFDNESCLRRLAAIAHQEGAYDVAIEYLTSLRGLAPQDPELLNSLGIAYQEIGDAVQARGCFERALAMDPQQVEVLCNYGELCNRQGEFEKGAELARRALSIEFHCAIAYNSLATSLKGLLKLADSEDTYRRAIAIEPNRAEYYNNLALVLELQGKRKEMHSAFAKAIKLDPEYASCFSNYAVHHLRVGELSKAKQLLDRAVEIDPHLTAAWSSLARCHFELGDIAASEKANRKCLELDPTDLIAMCSLPATMVGSDKIDDVALIALHREMARAVEEQAKVYAHDREAVAGRDTRKIAVGFVSADFKGHSVSYFLEPLVEAIDKDRFSLVFYSGVERPDLITDRYKSQADLWRDVAGLSDEMLARRIYSDEIDILVDLSGLTAGSRVRTFATKPAPVQIGWLGYPHSTGLTRIDYRIVDAITDPEGMTSNSEALLPLPHCFVCYRPPSDAPDIGSLPCAAGKGGVTFGCFNNITKLTDRCVGLFARVLEAVPNSRLFLKSHQVVDEKTRGRLLESFRLRGIEESRLRLIPRLGTTNEHLDTYNQVDIALDTFPYNGTTTTCEALWMGVPTLTLVGSRHASRVGASLLTVCGLEDFVAKDDDGLISTAVDLAADKEGLASLRRGLRERVARSPLRDEKGFARRFEAALDLAWNSFCGGEKQTVV